MMVLKELRQESFGDWLKVDKTVNAGKNYAIQCIQIIDGHVK